MIKRLIPTILIQDVLQSDLQQELETVDLCDLIQTVASDEWRDVARLGPSFHGPLVVINADGVPRETAVITGLLLRNLGYQVFVATVADWADLLEIMTDVFDHTTDAADKEAPLRTEVIVTEHAMEILGDIKPIVEHFEMEFMSERPSSEEADI